MTTKSRILEAVKALPPGAVVIGIDAGGEWTVTVLTQEAYSAVTEAMTPVRQQALMRETWETVRGFWSRE